MISSNWKALLAKDPKISSNRAKAKEKAKAKASVAVPNAAVALPRGKTGASDAKGSSVKTSGPGSAASGSKQTTGSGKTPELTTYLAIDCEMVGVGPGATRNSLARCSIVNFHGEVVYDKYVKQREPVTDFRTHVSGIRPQDISNKNPNAVDFKTCQEEVATLLKDRIVIGHALRNDLQCLLLSHPRHALRDTSHFKGLCPKRPKALKLLVQEHLGIEVQTGEHDSVEDARSVLALYKRFRKEWEAGLAQRYRSIKLKKSRVEAKAARKLAAFEREVEESNQAAEEARAAKAAAGKLRRIPVKTGGFDSDDSDDDGGDDSGDDGDGFSYSGGRGNGTFGGRGGAGMEDSDDEELEGSGVRVVPRKKKSPTAASVSSSSASAGPNGTGKATNGTSAAKAGKRKQPEPGTSSKGAGGKASGSSGQPAKKKRKR